MIELTGQEVVTTLLMERQLDGRAVLVVEGPTDCQLIDIHLESESCYTMVAGSKSAVLESAALSLAEDLDWVLFVVDTDFGDLVGPVSSQRNVVRTERYDLLMDVLHADDSLLRKAVVTHSSPGTEARLQVRFQNDVFSRIWEVAQAIGVLRYLVVSRRLPQLSTRKWPYRGISEDLESGQLLASLATIAAARCGGTLEAGRIESEIFEALRDLDAPSRLVSSHDLIAVTAEFMHAESGGQHAHGVLAGTIRASVGCLEFRGLAVIKAIDAWAVERGWSLFDCDRPLAA